MLLMTEDDQVIRGDAIKRIVLRSDATPIPLTLEAVLRIDDETKPFLQEGKKLKLESGDSFHIIKSSIPSTRMTQGSKDYAFTTIIAVLDSVHTVSFVRERAIFKENSVLSAVYSAAGAKIADVKNDFIVPRFSCPIGSTPTFYISKILHEEGGIVRWKQNKLEFLSLLALKKADCDMTLPNVDFEDIESGFLERHVVPSYYSLTPMGEVVHGNISKPRVKHFTPFKAQNRLMNMSRTLVLRKKARLGVNPLICAGDKIKFLDASGNVDLVVITAAHVYEYGAEDGSMDQYTRLWLGDIEE